MGESLLNCRMVQFLFYFFIVLQCSYCILNSCALTVIYNFEFGQWPVSCHDWFFLRLV